MGRVTRRPVLKIRYRKPRKEFGTTFSLSSNSNGKKVKGRILSVRKVSREQIDRIHDYLPFDPKALLREFREQEQQEAQGGIA